MQEKKPVILCGDLNVAHQEIDLANPTSNRDNAGFTDEEREGFSNLLAEGFLDTYRHLYPDQEGAFSWWSYRAGARSRNVGWRIDYFVVSESLATSVREATIHSQIEVCQSENMCRSRTAETTPFLRPPRHKCVMPSCFDQQKIMRLTFSPSWPIS